MGNQYLDAIWIIPVVLFVGWTCFVYLLGVEVGKDRQARIERDKQRHPAYRNRRRYGYTTEYPSNVIKFSNN
jgi:hypothetical protein